MTKKEFIASKNRLMLTFGEDGAGPYIELENNQRTRLVVHPHKFDNSGLRLKFIHQKKSEIFNTEFWETHPQFDKRTLKAGECVGCELGTEATKNLLECLPLIAQAANLDFDYGSAKIAKLKEDEQVVSNDDIEELRIFKELFEGKSALKVQAILEQVLPEAMMAKLSELKILDAKKETLKIFKEQLEAKAWNEKQWQLFFETNKWIFGYGINFCYLEHIRREGYCGGKDDTGTGGQYVDFMMASKLENAKFTLLVEIKTPQIQLITNDSQTEYRNKVYTIHRELIASVSQIQYYCNKWEREGSLYHENVKKHSQKSIYTYHPKGILIIGHTASLANDEDKLATLELFRRGLHNLDILTYDELYERAKYIIQQTTADLQVHQKGDDDDIPF